MTSEFQFNTSKKELDSKLDYEFELGAKINDFFSDHHRLPVWSMGLCLRYPNKFSVLTSYRNKVLPGYAIEGGNWNKSRSKSIEMARAGFWVVKPKDDEYKPLKEKGVRFIEKELFRSRKNRLFVYRFLGNDAKTVRAVSYRWIDDKPNSRTVRLEKAEKYNKFHVVFDRLDYDLKFPEKFSSMSGQDFWGDFDRFVFNLALNS